MKEVPWQQFEYECEAIQLLAVGMILLCLIVSVRNLDFEFWVPILIFHQYFERISLDKPPFIVLI